MSTLVKCAASLALTLVLAAPAAAGPILDFNGPPVAGTSVTSQFTGDWNDKTGTLLLDDLVVTALQFQDNSLQNLSSGTDTILGVDVLIQASFVDGVLDTGDSTADFIRISDGSDVFYEATIHSGSLEDFSFSFMNWDFASILNTDTSGAGLPKVNDVAAGSESDWIDENSTNLTNSGARIEFLGAVYGSVNGGANNDATLLSNISGKLAPVPEPGTLALFGAAAVGFVWVRRRKRA